MYLERVDPVSVALKRVQTFLPLWVPHLHHVVIGSRHDQSAVVLYAAHSCQMSHQHVQTLTALYVPHSQRRIPRPAHHPVKVTLVSYSVPLHSIQWGDHVLSTKAANQHHPSYGYSYTAGRSISLQYRRIQPAIFSWRKPPKPNTVNPTCKKASQ